VIRGQISQPKAVRRQSRTLDRTRPSTAATSDAGFTYLVYCVSVGSTNNNREKFDECAECDCSTLAEMAVDGADLFHFLAGRNDTGL